MSLRGTSLRSRSRLACLTLAVGLAAGLIAPAAAASTGTPAPTATATATPVATATPSAAPTASPEPTGTATPTATATPTPTATPTVVPTTSPTPAPEPTTAPDAVAFDGEISIASGPGTITLSVPPRASTGRYDEANIGYFVTQDDGVGVALDIVEQVPAEGLPARTIDVALPYSADWTVSVLTSGVDDGVELFRSEILRQTLRVLSAFDSCADGLDRSQANEPFTVDAVGGVGTIAVTVGAFALPDCFDEVTLRVLVKKFNNDDEQEGVELGPLQSDATFDGATVRGSFAPGRYFVVVLVSAAVDGEYGSLFQVFDPSVNIADDQREPIVVTAAAASTATATAPGRHLAATGVETAGAASGAAALLALGLVSLVAARRRRSAQQS